MHECGISEEIVSLIQLNNTTVHSLVKESKFLLLLRFRHFFADYRFVVDKKNIKPAIFIGIVLIPL